MTYRAPIRSSSPFIAQSWPVCTLVTASWGSSYGPMYLILWRYLARRWIKPSIASLYRDDALTRRGGVHTFPFHILCSLRGLSPPFQDKEVSFMAVGKVSDADFDSEVLKSASPV